MNKPYALPTLPARSLQVSDATLPEWPPASGDLPDVNVWLALAVQEHPHHRSAAAYWNEVQCEGRPLWFCRITMLGLIRLLCQPKVVGEGALGLAAAWRVYQGFRTVPGIGLLSEPADCDARLGSLLNVDPPLPSRLATDAWLAALAQTAELRLVSFDSDFRRFPQLRCRILSGTPE